MKLVQPSELLVFYTVQLSCTVQGRMCYYYFIDLGHWESGLLLLCRNVSL